MAKTMKQMLDRSENEVANERLGELLVSTLRYIPLLTMLVGIGFLLVYTLARVGLIGDPVWQLLAVTGVILFLTAAILPIINLARNQDGIFAYWLYVSVMSLAALLLVLFWQDILVIALLIAWMAPLTLVNGGLRRSYTLLSGLISALTSVLILWLNAHPVLERLSKSNPAGLTALILLASTIILFILTTFLSRFLRFRTLQARLVISFIIIITVPIIFTTGISVFNAFTNSENQFADTLQAISSLKQDQMDTVIQGILLELSTMQQGSGQASVLYIIDHPDDTDNLYQMNNSLASTRIRDFIVTGNNRYEEVLILNNAGKVLLSTYKPNEGISFKDQPFFQKGSSGYYIGLNKYPGKQNLAGDIKLLVAAPFYASYGQDARGVVVLVAKSELVTNILKTTPGLPDAETYLVDASLAPLTTTHAPPGPIQSRVVIENISQRSGEARGDYNNYAGIPVLGYVRWYPALQAALVAEIPQSDVLNKALSTLLLSSLVGIFTIVIAIITVISTSREISEPVSSLAGAAEGFANGKLNARAVADQDDEIGDLARSFNSMADQLEGIITNLEHRVGERTKDLELQTLRLRTAAEVARDAASAPNLDELLERSGRLIRDRFNLYHTGIFLLDEKKEYAVLMASPTDAGRSLIENHHRLRVGEQGIVGRVAATGEPRIALDTGVDPVYFSNPLLPATRSEMALALKSNEGIIGVLDIQSDQAEAFTRDDIAVMQVMADQLATAIERSRLLHQVESDLKEIERTYSGFTRKSWLSFEGTERQTPGYKYDNLKLEPIGSLSEEAMSAFDTGLTQITGSSAENPDSGRSAAIPIRLRGNTIGVLNIRFQNDQVQEKTIAMIEQISDRLAGALENARLLEVSMRSANKERVIGEITSKIGASVNIHNVLQTAVEELGRAIPGSDVVIQFQGNGKVLGEEKAE